MAAIPEKDRADFDAVINPALAERGLGGGPLANGAWVAFGRMPRLRLVGTGTVTLDARNRLGTVTNSVAAYTISGATNQIEFPFFGDDAVEVRATLTGTATAEII